MQGRNIDPVCSASEASHSLFTSQLCCCFPPFLTTCTTHIRTWQLKKSDRWYTTVMLFFHWRGITHFQHHTDLNLHRIPTAGGDAQHNSPAWEKGRGVTSSCLLLESKDAMVIGWHSIWSYKTWGQMTLYILSLAVFLFWAFSFSFR